MATLQADIANTAATLNTAILVVAVLLVALLLYVALLHWVLFRSSRGYARAPRAA